MELRQSLAVSVSGWQAKDLPIGETEEVREVAEKTLCYDDYFSRSYRKRDVELNVF